MQQHEQAFQQSMSQHMQQSTPGFPHQHHQNMQQRRQQTSQHQQQQQVRVNTLFGFRISAGSSL
jgi:hypothetical protein